MCILLQAMPNAQPNNRMFLNNGASGMLLLCMYVLLDISNSKLLLISAVRLKSDPGDDVTS